MKPNIPTNTQYHYQYFAKALTLYKYMVPYTLTSKHIRWHEFPPQNPQIQYVGP